MKNRIRMIVGVIALGAIVLQALAFFSSEDNTAYGYFTEQTVSKSVSDSRTSSTDSFSATWNYSDVDGYTGTLSKNGSSFVKSGSYVPAKGSKHACTYQYGCVIRDGDKYSGTVMPSQCAKCNGWVYGIYGKDPSYFPPYNNTLWDYNGVPTVKGICPHCGRGISPQHSDSYSNATKFVSDFSGYTELNGTCYTAFTAPYGEGYVTAEVDPAGVQVLRTPEGDYGQKGAHNTTWVWKVGGGKISPRTWNSEEHFIGKSATDTRVWQQNYSGTVYKTVIEYPKLASIKVLQILDKVNYQEDADFDTTGMIVEATYADGHKEIIKMKNREGDIIS